MDGGDDADENERDERDPWFYCLFVSLLVS